MLHICIYICKFLNANYSARMYGIIKSHCFACCEWLIPSSPSGFSVCHTVFWIVTSRGCYRLCQISTIIILRSIAHALRWILKCTGTICVYLFFLSFVFSERGQVGFCFCSFAISAFMMPLRPRASVKLENVAGSVTQRLHFYNLSLLRAQYVNQVSADLCGIGNLRAGWRYADDTRDSRVFLFSFCGLSIWNIFFHIENWTRNFVIILLIALSFRCTLDYFRYRKIGIIVLWKSCLVIKYRGWRYKKRAWLYNWP